MGTVHQFPTEAERQAMKPLPVSFVRIERPRELDPQSWGFASKAEMYAAWGIDDGDDAA